jgi:hypothetical protein
MVLGLGALVTAYVVIGTGLLVLVLYANLGWRAKLALIIATSACYVLFYHAFAPLQGWPARLPTPKRFGIVAVYLQEPDEVTGAIGNIYFWVQDLTRGEMNRRPRAHRVEWTPEFRAVARETGQKLKQNIPQVGETLDEEELGRIGRPTDESAQGQKSHKVRIQIKDSAPVGPPPKIDAAPDEAA